MNTKTQHSVEATLPGHKNRICEQCQADLATVRARADRLKTAGVPFYLAHANDSVLIERGFGHAI